MEELVQNKDCSDYHRVHGNVGMVSQKVNRKNIFIMLVTHLSVFHRRKLDPLLFL